MFFGEIPVEVTKKATKIIRGRNQEIELVRVGKMYAIVFNRMAAEIFPNLESANFRFEFFYCKVRGFKHANTEEAK
jgi:hypothetical protein